MLAPTTSQPDFATARGIAGGPVIGATGRVDWNDVFQPVVSEQDLRNQTGGTGSDSFGRQFAWSSDGQKIYAVDSSSSVGGIYRIDPTRSANDPGGVEQIYSNQDVPSGYFSVRSEPAVVHTSVFDFAPGSPEVGDQILVEGNIVSGNEGGLNVMVDTGAETLGEPTVVFTADEFRYFADYFSETTFFEGDVTSNRSPRYVSVADAPNGDLYLYEQQTDVMFRYDTQGRFSKVASEREHNLFQDSVTGSTNPFRGNDDMSNISIRTATVPGGFEVTELIFVDSTINAPIGLLVYEPGDFDRDNDVDSADLESFAAALGTRNHVADDANVIYDLNGSAEAYRNTDTNDVPYIAHISNEGMVVDWKDVKVLQQFVEFPNGDANFDFALDFADLDVMSANYYTTGQSAAVWTLGDFASADPLYLFDAPDANLVNEVDLAVLADAWLNDLDQEAPSDAALAARYSGQFLTDAIAAFAAGGGLPGDYDGDGDVDHGDYDVWALTTGAIGADLDADGNGDGLVDAADYTVWRNALVIDPLASDFNSDGVVDAADYVVWRNSVGDTGEDLAADANGDRTVDADDFALWAEQYGNTATDAAAIPEPAALLLAWLGGFAGLGGRRP